MQFRRKLSLLAHTLCLAFIFSSVVSSTAVSSAIASSGVDSATTGPKIYDDGTAHPYFEIITSAFDKVESSFQQNKVLSTMVKPILKEEISVVSEHYKNLIADTAGFMKAFTIHSNKFDVGTSENGYYAINDIVTPQLMEQLTTYYPAALHKFESLEGQMSFDEWAAEFNGNTYVAMTGFILNLGWINNALPTDIKSKLTRLSISVNSRYAVGLFDEFEYMGVEGAFGLNLKRKMGWGRAYKVFAGINLALALAKKGYSAPDIQFAIDRANLVYEASDFLYDHLGEKRSDTFQAQDKEDITAIEEYKVFWPQYLNLLKQDTDLKSQMIGSLFGFPNAISAAAHSVDTVNIEDKFVAAMLLISFKKSQPQIFEEKVGSLISDSDSGRAFAGLIDAAINDMNKVNEGAEFATANLVLEDISERPEIYQGVLHLQPTIESLFKAYKPASGLLNSLKSKLMTFPYGAAH